MLFLQKFFPKKSADRFHSWHMVMALAIIVVFCQCLAGFHLSRITSGEPLQVFRFIHAMLGFISIGTLVAFKDQWRSRYSRWLFFILFCPFYITTWFSQIVYVKAGLQFSPFLPIKLYPIVLAFLVPGSYWVNLIMMLLFYVEGVVLWYFLDFPSITNVLIPNNEPITTILFAGVSFTLLFFRYRDEQAFKKLVGKKLNAETYENLTRMFLSLRDRGNTPLQNQRLITELIRRRYPDEQEIIIPLQKSVDSLTAINDLLRRFESIPVMDQRLMSEQEIVHYLERIEKDNSESLVT